MPFSVSFCPHQFTKPNIFSNFCSISIYKFWTATSLKISFIIHEYVTKHIIFFKLTYITTQTMKATFIPKIRSHKRHQQKSHGTYTYPPTQTFCISVYAASISFHYPDCLYTILVAVTFHTFTH
jgi:hypothetical protein